MSDLKVSDVPLGSEANETTPDLIRKYKAPIQTVTKLKPSIDRASHIVDAVLFAALTAIVLLGVAWVAGKI